MTVSSVLKGLLAGVTVATMGAAMAQGTPPRTDVANPALGAGQRNTENAPMGMTGTPAGTSDATRMDSGATGTMGASGTNGTTGTTGTMGASGTNGTMGTTGSMGTRDVERSTTTTTTTDIDSTRRSTMGAREGDRMRADRN